jgi:hypothetical protein
VNQGCEAAYNVHWHHVLQTMPEIRVMGGGGKPQARSSSQIALAMLGGLNIISFVLLQALVSVLLLRPCAAGLCAQGMGWED